MYHKCTRQETRDRENIDEMFSYCGKLIVGVFLVMHDAHILDDLGECAFFSLASFCVPISCRILLLLLLLLVCVLLLPSISFN